MNIKTFLSAHLLRGLARWTIYLLSFLLPVFFLNFTVETLETAKQLLLVVVVAVILLSWLGAAMLEKKFVLRGGWLTNLLPLGFLIAVLVSSFFSLAGYRTWVGQGSQEYTSFLTIFCFVGLFLAVEHLADEAGFRKKIFAALLTSSILAAVLSWPYLFGWAEGSFFIGSLTNPVGSITTFAIYLIVMGLLSLGLSFIHDKKRPWLPLASLLILGTALLLNLSIGFWLLWGLLAFGSLVLGLSFLVKGGSRGRLLLPFLLFAFSVGLIFVSSPIKLKTPVVISPSYSASLEIAEKVLSEGSRTLFFGSGPGTFLYDYAKYKALGVNETFLWNLNFDRAKANFLNSLATLGILGSSLWLMFVVWLLFRIWKNQSEPAFVAAWLVLVAAQIVYSSNLTLAFLFWIFSACLIAQSASQSREINFSRAPRLGMIFSFGFIVLSLVSVVMLTVVGCRYASEVTFAKAARIDQAGASAETVSATIGQAISYNNYSDFYYKNYSQALLKQASLVFSDYTGDGSEINDSEKQVLQKLLVAAMTAADQAASLGSNDVTNWRQRGQLYREVMNLVGEAEEVSATSYLTANQLEPNNPIHLIDLARLYLIVANRAETLKDTEDKSLSDQAVQAEVAALASAEKYLVQAVELKKDYAPAHYYLAAVYERQGRTREAIDRLKLLLQGSSDQLGLGLQLALLYIQIEDYASAQTILEKLVEAQPDYSNARWYLASVFELNGDFAHAIEQVTKVLELNFDNELVKARLSQLIAGRLEAEMPPPVEEGATETEGELIE